MSITKAAGIITLGFALSRILGYLRLKALSFVFGANIYTDAYVAAFRVPDLLYFLLGGGALSAAFIPVYTGLLQRNDRQQARELAWTVAVALLGSALIGIALLELFMPLFVKLVFPSFDPVRQRLTVYYSRLLAPMVLLTVLSGISTGICQSHKLFAYPAFAYIFYNIPVILATFLFGKTYGIPALCGAVLVGSFLLFAAQTPVLVQEKLLRPAINWFNVHARKVLKLFLPAMLGIAVSQVNLFLVPVIFATRLEQGVVTDVEYATRLILLPLGIFGMALSQAIFPFLSEQAENSRERFSGMLARGVVATFFFSLPSLVFIAILSQPLVTLLFAGGAMTPRHLAATAEILAFFSLGFPPLFALQVTVRGFHARQDTTTPLWTGLISLGIHFAAASLLIEHFSHRGIALASSIAQWANFLIHFAWLKRKQILHFESDGWKEMAKIAGISLLAGTGLWIGKGKLPGLASFSPYTVFPSVLLLTVLFSLLYLLGGYKLKVRELHSVIAIVAQKKRSHKAS